MSDGIALPRWTREEVEALSSDRDAIPMSERLELWDERDARHHENLNSNANPGFGLMIVSGDKGIGKSNFMTALAGQYYDLGFNVVSNMGTLFGHRMTAATDIFLFLKTLPEKTVVLVDEIHIMFSIYRQGAARQVEFVKDLAGLRKNAITIIGGTSQEESVDYGVRRECDYVYYPYPRKYRPVHKRRKSQGPGFAALPKWCQVHVDRIGPKPWGSGQKLGEKFGIPLRTVEPRREKLKNITPLNIYQGAALQWSFEGIPQGEMAGTDLSSKEFNEAAAQAKIYDLDAGNAGPVTGMQLRTTEELLIEIYRFAETQGWFQRDNVGLGYLIKSMDRGGYSLKLADVEKALEEWIDHRPGSKTVNMQDLMEAVDYE